MSDYTGNGHKGGTFTYNSGKSKYPSQTGPAGVSTPAKRDFRSCFVTFTFFLGLPPPKTGSEAASVPLCFAFAACRFLYATCCLFDGIS